MKRLFLPLALLTMSTVYSNASLLKDDELADDSAGTVQQQEQVTDQAAQAMLQEAGDQIAVMLLKNPDLATWYNGASSEDEQQFDRLCVQSAALNMMINAQFAGNYNQLFNELSELTGCNNWSVQISFMSQELAQALQAQAAAAEAQVACTDDGDTE